MPQETVILWPGSSFTKGPFPACFYLTLSEPDDESSILGPLAENNQQQLFKIWTSTFKGIWGIRCPQAPGRHSRGYRQLHMCTGENGESLHLSSLPDLEDLCKKEVRAKAKLSISECWRCAPTQAASFSQEWKLYGSRYTTKQPSDSGFTGLRTEGTNYRFHSGKNLNKQHNEKSWGGMGKSDLQNRHTMLLHANKGGRNIHQKLS